MPELPSVPGKAVIAAFGKIGFELDRVRGSHHVLKKDGHLFVLTVPVHGNEPIKKGTLRRLIRDAGITKEEFCKLL